MTDHQLQDAVRARYTAAAQRSLRLAGDTGASCCGGSADPITRDLYPNAPFAGAASASLGCGNPTALIDLSPGQDVLDLGSGGGLDVLLSARRVAPGGTAYGVDSTSEMVTLAERNRAEAGIDNARFVQGTIESLPLPDESVDVVISNCVINLSTDKDAVLAEAFRVLRPGGRLAVADVVLLRALEPRWVRVAGLWTGCIVGALTNTEYLDKLAAAGFTAADVQLTRRYDRDELAELAEPVRGELPPGSSVTDAVAALDGALASAFIRAGKPTGPIPG